jgi:PAS domain S-box-containing protein
MNYQDKTKEEIIVELKELQHDNHSLKELYKKTKSDQKLAQETIRKYDHQTQLLIETASEGILIAQGEYLKYVNPVIIELMGYSKEYLLSQPFIEFVHTEDRELIRVNYIKRISGEQVGQKYQVRILTLNNIIKVVEFSGAKIEWEGQPAILNFIRDISKSLQTEENLHESEERFRALFEKASEGIFYISPDTKLLKVNESFARMHGYTMDEMEKMQLQDLNTPECVQLTNERISRVLKGEILQFEVEHYHKDGHVFPLSVSTGLVTIRGKKVIQAFHHDITERKRIEKEIRENESRFHAFIEQAPIAIGVFDLKGIGMYSNQKFADTLGLPNIEEVIGRPAHEFFVPRFREESKERTRLRLLGLPVPMEYESIILRPDGTELPVKLEVSPIRLAGETVSIAFLTDISHRKLVEIHASLVAEVHDILLSPSNPEAIFRLVAEKIQQLIGDCITATSILDEKHRTLRMGSYHGLDFPFQKMLAIIGFDPFQKEFLLGDMSKEVLNVYNNGRLKTIDGGLYSLMTGIVPKAACKIVEKLLGIKKFYGIGFIHKNEHLGSLVVLARRDITPHIAVIEQIVNLAAISIERAQAETALMESEKKYKALFESNADGITIFLLKENNPPDTILDMNENAYKMLGYTKEEMFELNPSELEINLTKEKLETRIEELKTRGFSTFETIVRHKNGDNVFVEMKALIINYNNQPALMNIVRDITQRKNAEKELLLAKEKAEESDRLKSSFLNNISHEVRTPLNAISGFSELITIPNQSPEKLETYSKMISKSSDRLIRIITDVVEMSQIHSNQITLFPSEFEIISFFNNMSEGYRRMAKEKPFDFSVKMDIPFKEYFIISDAEKIKKIIDHLIDNALKFTHNGGVEIIYDLVVQTGHAPSANDTGHAPYLQITISDTGIGISEEMQKIIFEPFRQVEVGIKRNYGGNGVGLSIAKAYTESLNGSISLKSEINSGTTVLISIPVNESTKHVSIKLTPQPDYSINTILIVEDDYSNFRYLADLLEETNLTILHAANGKQALDFCATNNTIGLVLMDIEMPEMDGHTATKLIKEIHPEIPVLAQTAYVLDSEKAKYHDVFDDYISKPISRSDLKQKLMKYIGPLNVNNMN